MSIVLARITSELVGTKYALGSSDGMDCFKLCTEYLKIKGAKIPDDTMYKGHKIFDYKDMYQQSPLGTIKLAIEYLSHLTKEIKPGFEVAGDILVMHLKRGKSKIPNLGIEAGNGFLITAINNNSIKVVSKKFFEIEKVLRWE